PIQYGVVITGSEQLRHHGEDGDLDVCRDRNRTPGDRRGVETTSGFGPHRLVFPHGAEKIDGERSKHRGAFAFTRYRFEAESAMQGADEGGHCVAQWLAVVGTRDPVAEHDCGSHG